MQWRRIVFSFVIVLGATLWALPFSAYAFDFCFWTTSSSDMTCPGTSKYATGCTTAQGHDCFSPTTGVGTGFEHCCQSSIDPCAIGTPIGATISCAGGKSKITSCSGSVATACIDPIKLTAPPVAVTTDALCTNSSNKGICSVGPSCSGATPNNIGLCSDATKPVCCSANTVAANVLANDVTTTVKNPLAFSTVEGVLGSILSTLQAIIVVLALISIVIGGILYVTSAGDDERMKTAKGAITAAAIGLALGLAAPSFLKQIGTILGWGTVAPTVDCSTLPLADQPACQIAQATLLAGKSLSAIALSALQFLLSIVGVLGIIMLVIGGLTYLTSAGNEEQSESGKKIVTYAIIGIAVALASLIAVTQIAGLFV